MNAGEDDNDMDNKTKRIQTFVQGYVDQHGSISSDAYVDEARPEDSPIHDTLEWDNSIAGEEYRLIQARTLLRRVKIVYEQREERLIHVPRIETAEKGSGEYKPVTVVAQSISDFERALGEAIKRMRSAEQAVDDLRRAAGESDDERLAILAVAMQGLATAQSAINRIQPH